MSSGKTEPKIIENVDSKSLDKIKKDISMNGCILLYYWTKCYYCEKFKPIWEELKKRYGDNKQFYKIELSTIQKAPNEFKAITGFPTIVAYVGDGTSKRIRYSNMSRDINSVSNFIEENVPDYKEDPNKIVKKKKEIKKPNKIIKKKLQQTPQKKFKT